MNNQVYPSFKKGLDEIDILRSIANPAKLQAKMKLDDKSDGIYNVYDLLQIDVQELPTLLEPIFPKVGLIALAGSSDTGKSSFLRQFAISVCSGADRFLGFKINPTHRKGIYVSTEDDDANTIAWLLKKSAYINGNPHEYSGLTYLLDSENIISKLDKLLTEAQRDFVIIDAFTDLYTGSMNETNKVRSFLNEFGQLARRHQCLFIFLHHTAKRTESLSPSKHNLLGSQGFEAKMRLVLELRADPVDSTSVHLCIVKGNYLQKSFKNESFVMNFENFTFRMTGQRVAFDELKSDDKMSKKDKANELFQEGKTQTEIAKIMGVGQATISRYLK